MPASMPNCRRLIRLAAVTLVVAGLVLPAARAQAQDSDELVAFFSDLVFGADRENADPATLYVKKWQQPLSINVNAIEGELVTAEDGEKELRLARSKPTPTQVRIIDTHLRTVIGLTGVEIDNPDETGNPVNLRIKLVPRVAMGAPFLEESVDPRLLQALARSGVCYLLTWADKSGAIDRGLIVVNADLPEAELSACVLEELSQVMGLAGESDRITPSVFNSDSQLQELTRIDRILLKGLYDERIEPGSRPEAARAAAAQVLSELARESP